MTNRYDTSHTIEGQFQSDSNHQVLLNKLNISDPHEMESVELDLLSQLTDVVINNVAVGQTITVSDLCEWHRCWLGNVYVWAGQYRTVNMSKGDMHFATAHLIPKLMQTFERKFLSIYSPCYQMNFSGLVEAIAIVHIELILIHPFREGNGRLSRLLANVMAVQAGLNDAEPMKAIFKQVLRETQQNAI